MKETVYDCERHTVHPSCGYDDPSAKFSHYEIEHLPPLASSDSPVVNGLIKMGYSVHPTLTTFFFSLPSWMAGFGNSSPMQKREEWQLEFEQGFLRFRMEEQDTVFLTLFSIHPEHRGKGFARRWFPELIDALFKAGARYARGKVAPSYSERTDFLNITKLTSFYVETGFKHLGRGEIWKESPYKTPLGNAPQLSPNSQATDTPSASQITKIS